MTLPVALGANLWVVAVALPMLLAAHARALDGVSTGALVVASLLPLVALGVGARLARVEAQAWALLVAFPVLVVAPQALAAADVTARVVPAAASVLAAASLLAYLGSVVRAQARAERAADGGSAVATRKLHQDPVPSRWRRRLRVYRGLTAVALVFPLVLVGAVGLSPSFAASLDAAFGANAARAQALATVGVGLLWIVLLRVHVLLPLHGHLQHDRDLLRTMERDRRHARRGRPRAGFYVAVTVALVAMAAVVWQRAR
ncbi:MAG TPA: hypothetical protein VF945_03835 [Polyangia bacterium]